MNFPWKISRVHEIRYISAPVRSIYGKIHVPGDKSISHRAVILGSISLGVSTVHGFLDSDDCRVTIKAFESMGVSITKNQANALIIYGVGKHGLKSPSRIIDCGNSGTSMRLLTGLLSAQNFASELDGDLSLRQRPMSRISIPLKLMGANITTRNGMPPIKIIPTQKISGVQYAIPEASAQVKSCLLLAGMYADSITTIIEPRLTRDHMELLLSAFHYPLKYVDHPPTRKLIIKSSAECSATEITIPGDMSAAAYLQEL